MKNLSMILSLTLIFAARLSFAGVEGEKELFIMEKSRNFENKMVIYTRTDENCKFITGGSNDAYLDFYWMMKGVNRKEVHPMIKKKVFERVAFEKINSDHSSFSLRLNDLTEVKHDLDDTLMEITSDETKEGCKIKSLLTLGPTGNHAKIDLHRIYCDVSTHFGVPNGCNYIELEGVNIKNNNQIKVRFEKR